MAEGAASRAEQARKTMDYLVMFLAHWFGARRFDRTNADGFDPTDVEAFRANHGTGFLRRNFRRSRSVLSTEPREEIPAAQAADEAPVANAVTEHAAAATDTADEWVKIIEGKQLKPWFVVAQVTAIVLLWMIFGIYRWSKGEGDGPLLVLAGLDSLSPGGTDLRMTYSDCEDLRWQVWRWITYQWTHVSGSQVLANAILLIMLGMPLEGHEGTKRMLYLFNVGIIGGALAYYVGDAHNIVVGCSGGCYSLLGAHVADLLLNWKQKKFARATFAMILLLVGVDAMAYAINLALEWESISFSVNIGGFIAGFLLCGVIGKNIELEEWERSLKKKFTFVGGLLILACLLWMSYNRAPLNLFEAMRGEEGFCWFKQAWIPAVSETHWQCIRCSTKACIDDWANFTTNPVDLGVCREVGWYFPNATNATSP